MSLLCVLTPFHSPSTTCARQAQRKCEVEGGIETSAPSSVLQVAVKLLQHVPLLRLFLTKLYWSLEWKVYFVERKSSSLLWQDVPVRILQQARTFGLSHKRHTRASSTLFAFATYYVRKWRKKRNYAHNEACDNSDEVEDILWSNTVLLVTYF